MNFFNAIYAMFYLFSSILKHVYFFCHKVLFIDVTQTVFVQE